jgi:hypothetical protein
MAVVGHVDHIRCFFEGKDKCCLYKELRHEDLLSLWCSSSMLIEVPRRREVVWAVVAIGWLINQATHASYANDASILPVWHPRTLRWSR